MLFDATSRAVAKSVRAFATQAEGWVFESPVMVKSPYEWKILDWDEKPQTKKTRALNYTLTNWSEFWEKSLMNWIVFDCIIYDMIGL